MADLVQKNKIGIKTAGSLQSRMAQKEMLDAQRPPEERTHPKDLENRICVMIDCSGSMAGEPIKLLESALSDFIAKSNPTSTAIAVRSFGYGYDEEIDLDFSNDKLLMWTRLSGLTANGGTPMADAMRHCIETRKELTRAIIISDGQPDTDPTNYGETAKYKERGISVDTIHVGMGSAGEDCLRRISELTGGLFVKFKDIKQFSTAFAFLLPETRNEAPRLMLTAGANEVK